MYGSVTNTYVKENPCMVLIPSSVSKSTGKYCMAEKPSHLSRVSLSYPVEIGLKYNAHTNLDIKEPLFSRNNFLAASHGVRRLT